MRTLVSKSEYARLKNRSRQAVSNWIKSGAISKNALVGIGHRAKIWVEQADSDLVWCLSPGQQSSQERPANPAASRASNAPDRSLSDADEYLVRRRKADAERAEYAAEEARRRLEVDAGKWVDREDMERTFNRILAREISNIEYFMRDALPQALMSGIRPGMDWKDLSILIRREWYEYRNSAADRLEREATEEA